MPSHRDSAGGSSYTPVCWCRCSLLRQHACVFSARISVKANHSGGGFSHRNRGEASSPSAGLSVHSLSGGAMFCLHAPICASIHTSTHTHARMLKCIIDLNTEHSIARPELCTVKQAQRRHQRTVQSFVPAGSNREN